LMVVQPETVLRWHRHWLRRRWAHRSTRIRPGRPSTDAAIRALVHKMAGANPLWGAPRIHGELGKLGIEVSERTVSRLLPRRGRPPSQTWRTFLGGLMRCARQVAHGATRSLRRRRGRRFRHRERL
jgi:transposase